MSLNFFTSSSDRRTPALSRSRVTIAVFFGSCLIFILAGVCSYSARGLARHPEDIKLRMLRQSDGAYDRLILSDSVTENATIGIAFDKSDLPILTNGWLKLAGQYFILRRTLETHSIRQMDLFMVPELLVTTVNDAEQGRIRHTYTDTLFTRSDEIDDLRAAGDAEAGRKFVLFELLYKSFQSASRELPRRSQVHRQASRPSTPTDSSAENQSAIEFRRKTLTEFEITAQNRFFLRRISEACARASIVCRIIIEPAPASLPRIDLAAVRKVAPGVEVIDVNEFASFPDAAFRDGLHLRGPDWTGYYRSVLADMGLVRFGGSTVEPWDGRAIGLAAESRENLAMLSDFHAPEAWGRWTNGTHAEATVNIDAQKVHSALALHLRALATKGPQRVTIAINGHEVCSEVLAKAGDAVVSCNLPEGAVGETRIAISTSYAQSPVEWGANDSRVLGIGVKAIALE